MKHVQNVLILSGTAAGGYLVYQQYQNYNRVKANIASRLEQGKELTTSAVDKAKEFKQQKLANFQEKIQDKKELFQEKKEALIERKEAFKEKKDQFIQRKLEEHQERKDRNAERKD